MSGDDGVIGPLARGGELGRTDDEWADGLMRRTGSRLAQPEAASVSNVRKTVNERKVLTLQSLYKHIRRDH